MNEKKHEKNYGIEWLRILSMYMVAVLHTLGQGGILGSFKQGDLSFSIAWFLETAAFGAVDCFALISGYVGYHSHFRYKKGMRLWFQTFFYTLGITILFAIFMPEAVTKDQWIAAFFPIMKKQYWYMTAYAGLFILIPILNRAIVNLSGRELLKICLAIFVVFSLIPTLLNETVFGLGGGYSAIWLLLLYICGGFWGKYHEICLTYLPDFLFSSSSFSAIFILSALHNYKLSVKNVWLFPICQLHLANYFTWLLCLILSFFSYALQQKEQSRSFISRPFCS